MTDDTIIDATITKSSLDRLPDTISLINRLQPDLDVSTVGSMTWYDAAGDVTTDVACALAKNAASVTSVGNSTVTLAASKGITLTWSATGQAGSNYIGRATWKDSVNDVNRKLIVVLRCRDGSAKD